MSTSDRGYFAPLSHDLRVRERLLGAGIISQAEIDTYLANLPDNEGNSESLGIIGQPALNTPQPPAPPAPAPIRISPPIQTSSTSADIDDDDDEDDDDEDEDEAKDEVEQVAAAPVEEHAAPTNTIAVGEPTPGLPVETREAVEAQKDAEAEAATETPVEAAAEATPPEEAPKADGETEAAPAPEAASATTEEHVV